MVIASRIPGSTVILCTDGEANIGIGRLQGIQRGANVDDFYQFVADYGKDKGFVFLEHKKNNNVRLWNKNAFSCQSSVYWDNYHDDKLLHPCRRGVSSLSFVR